MKKFEKLKYRICFGISFVEEYRSVGGSSLHLKLAEYFYFNIVKLIRFTFQRPCKKCEMARLVKQSF